MSEPIAELPAPRNVIEALNAVMSDLPGISRGLDSSQGYKYRGIEQITVEAQPLFAKHGVVFAPSVDSYEVKDITVNNKPWTDTILMVRYRVYGPGGPSDFIDVGPIVGIGRDNSDKGANKAMTQAFKYALIQTFTIADAKDDGDQQSHEADARRPEPTPAQKERGAFKARVLASPVKDRFIAWNAEQKHPTAAADMNDAQLAKAVEWMDNAEDELAHASEAPPLAPVVPVQPSEVTDAPIPAQESPRPSEPEVQDGRLAAATAYVKGLDAAQLLVAFSHRKLQAPRPVGEQRIALTAALMADENWQPEGAGQEALL